MGVVAATVSAVIGLIEAAQCAGSRQTAEWACSYIKHVVGCAAALALREGCHQAQLCHTVEAAAVAIPLQSPYVIGITPSHGTSGIAQYSMLAARPSCGSREACSVI